MGGAGSVSEWVSAGLGQPDYAHLTTAGYRMLGEMLLDQMMDQYKRFLAVRERKTIVNGQSATHSADRSIRLEEHDCARSRTNRSLIPAISTPSRSRIW